MTRMVIFGDSYGCHDFYHCTGEDYSWFNMFSEKIKAHETINMAVSGSNIEYSLLKMFQFYVDGRFDKNDIVIFIVSQRTRSPLNTYKLCNQSPSALSYYSLQGTDKSTLTPELQQHINHAGSFYDLFYSSITSSESYTVSFYCNLLYLCKAINLQTIVLSFDGLSENTVQKIKTIDAPVKVLNVPLIQISIDEIEYQHNTDTIYSLFGSEIRNNHLCKSNHIQLCDEVMSMLTYNSVVKSVNPAVFKNKILSFKQKPSDNDLISYGYETGHYAIEKIKKFYYD